LVDAICSHGIKCSQTHNKNKCFLHQRSMNKMEKNI
jgi:hypothetical protein